MRLIIEYFGYKYAIVINKSNEYIFFQFSLLLSLSHPNIFIHKKTNKNLFNKSRSESVVRNCIDVCWKERGGARVGSLVRLLGEYIRPQDETSKVRRIHASKEGAFGEKGGGK